MSGSAESLIGLRDIQPSYASSCFPGLNHNSQPSVLNLQISTDPTAKALPPRPPSKQARWSTDSWASEILSCVFSLAATAAVAAVLLVYDNKPRPKLLHNIGVSIVPLRKPCVCARLTGWSFAAQLGCCDFRHCVEECSSTYCYIYNQPIQMVEFQQCFRKENTSGSAAPRWSQQGSLGLLLVSCELERTVSGHQTHTPWVWDQMHYYFEVAKIYKTCIAFDSANTT